MKYKKIADLVEYNKYCEIHENLVFQNNEKFIDEIELLEVLIDEYDRRVNATAPEMNPVEILRSIMKDEKISNVQLAKELGISRQLISDILNYRRNISKDMVIKLAYHFKLRQDAFSRPYHLKEQKIQSNEHAA